MPVVPTFIRWISRRALRWFYRELRFVGRGRIPAQGPVLLIGNHPNDLPDVLAGFFTTPRAVRYVATISATTLPLAAATYRGLGVIPVMRVRDVRKMRARGVDVAQVNTVAFAMVQKAFRAGDVVGIFPEGGVHDTSMVGRPRVGVAKMALEYLVDGSDNDLKIIAFGLQYENGQIARTDAMVLIGEPLSLRAWVASEQAAGRPPDSTTLSARMHEALLAVTRNSHSWHDAGLRDRLIAAVAAVNTAPGGSPIETAAAVQHQCALLVSGAHGAELADSKMVHWQTIAEPIAEAIVRAGGLDRSARDATRVLQAAGVPDVVAQWPSAVWLAVCAGPAVIGLTLHAPLWAAARWSARRLMAVRTDYAAKAILPGLHLILLGYLLMAAVSAVVFRTAGWSPWWALALVVLLPSLGDLALSWSDGVRAWRLRARVRAWPATERSALQEAAQRLRRAWAAVS